MIACTCPNCGEELQLNDRFAGTTHRCRHCQQQFVVPPSEDQMEATIEAGCERSSKMTKKEFRVRIFLAVIVLFSSLAGAFFAIMADFHWHGPPRPMSDKARFIWLLNLAVTPSLLVILLVLPARKAMWAGGIVLVAALIAVGIFQKNQENDERVAVRSIIERAESGDSNAQWELALMHDAGQRLARNQDETIHWMTTAAENGHVIAQYSAARFYENGKMRYPEMGLMHDYPLRTDLVNQETATRFYLAAAKQGHFHSQYEMAERFRNGIGIERNVVEAYDWYRKLGLNKNENEIVWSEVNRVIYGIHQAAKRFRNGEGVTEDNEIAFRLFLKSAEGADRSAAMELARMVLDGFGSENDELSAFAFIAAIAYQPNLDDPGWLPEARSLYDRLTEQIGEERLRENTQLISFIGLDWYRTKNDSDIRYRLDVESTH